MLTMEPSRKRRRTEGKSYKYPYGKYTAALRKMITDEYPRGSEGSIETFGATYADALPRQKATRMALRFKGEGDYLQDLMRGQWFKRNKAVGRGIRALGSLAGGRFGAAAGGREAAGNISKWLGFGDYGQIGNQIMSHNSQTPAFVNAADKTGDIYLSHREFVGEIFAEYDSSEITSHFAQQKFRINPGDATTFPWLNRLATQFEIYDFEGLMFQYIPKYGEGAGSSNALGKVILATNYDPSAPDFKSTVQMQNYDYSTSTKPSIGVLHGIETDNKQQVLSNLYVKSTAGEGTDTRWTDLGNMYVATEGVPRATTGSAERLAVGEIYVTYRVRLSRAVIQSNSIVEDPSSHFIVSSVFTNPSGTSNLQISGDLKYDPAHNLSNSFIITGTQPDAPAGSFTISWGEDVPLGLYHLTCMVFDSGSKQITWQSVQGWNNTSGIVPFSHDGTVTAVNFIANNHASTESGQPALLQCYFSVAKKNGRIYLGFKTSPAEYAYSSDKITCKIDYLGLRDDGFVKTGQ